MPKLSFKPPKKVVENAERGLRWRREYGRGGTAVGVARARDLKNRRNVSLDTIRRMVSYFSRHDGDKEAVGFYHGEFRFPTAGRVAWELWGGDEGQRWAKRILREYGD